MATRTYDIGYSVQMGYGSGKSAARKHAVEKDESGDWKLRCTGTPGTREYKGFAGTINCRDCKKTLEGP